MKRFKFKKYRRKIGNIFIHEEQISSNLELENVFFVIRSVVQMFIGNYEYKLIWHYATYLA